MKKPLSLPNPVFPIVVIILMLFLLFSNNVLATVRTVDAIFLMVTGAALAILLMKIIQIFQQRDEN